MEMRRLGFHAKNIVAAGYDPVAGILAVQFKTSGTYRYIGVPEDVFVKLCRSLYPDRQFMLTVKGKYPVEKPEKVSDGQDRNEPEGYEVPASAGRSSTSTNIQDTAGRDSNRGHEDHLVGDSKPIGGSERPGGSAAQLPNGRCDVIRPGEGGRLVELYRAENGLTFEEDGHKYVLDGKRLISLTQILDAAGLVDYSAVQPDVLANKAKFGTKVHEYTKWMDQGELEPEDLVTLKAHPTYGPRINGWNQFCDDFNFCMDLSWCEVPCAVKVNGMTYAMTIDRFGTIGPATAQVHAVVEIKTCCDREFSHQIQTAGQALPFRGDGSVPIKRYAVYLLDKPKGAGKLYFAQQHEERNDEKLFLAALMLTQARINNKLMKG
jgi:hypothetical protein